MPTRTLLLLAALLFVAHGEAQAKLVVVTTLPDLGAIAKAVGGDAVEVRSLVEATEDPHYVDPRPSFVVTLSKADLLVFNGLELEVGWLPPLIVNARNPRIQLGALGHVDASTLVGRLEQVPTGKVDRAMGDVHPGGNPHYTWSPRAMAEVARGLAGRMALLDSKESSGYVARAEALAKELLALEAAQRDRFAKLPATQRRIVVYHDSLVYLVGWLGLEQVATIEQRPGIKPSPGRVADVLKLMKTRGVKVILQEAWHPDTPAVTLAKLAGGKLLGLPGGTAGKQTITAHLDDVANRIHDALASP